MDFGVSHFAYEAVHDASCFFVYVHSFAASVRVAATTIELKASKLHQKPPSQPDQGSGGQLKDWSMATAGTKEPAF